MRLVELVSQVAEVVIRPQTDDMPIDAHLAGHPQRGAAIRDRSRADLVALRQLLDSQLVGAGGGPGSSRGSDRFRVGDGGFPGV